MLQYTEDDIKKDFFLRRLKFMGPPLHVFKAWTNIAECEREKFVKRHGKEPTGTELDERIEFIHTNIATVGFYRERLDKVKWLNPEAESKQ